MTLFLFNHVQTFYIDPDAVAGAQSVDVSSIDIAFKTTPRAVGNRSGINYPGVTITLGTITPDNVPEINFITAGSVAARVDYINVNPSADASLWTKFKFDKPKRLETGKEYAFAIQFDGSEDFELWTSKTGNPLVGTNQSSPGPSGKYIGKYFSKQYINDQEQTSDGITINWNAQSDTDLKFRVNVARYAINGNGVTSSDGIVYSPTESSNTSNVVIADGQATFTLLTETHEFITFSSELSHSNVFSGEHIFQMAPIYPGGSANGLTVSIRQGNNYVIANGTLPNGTAFSWNNVYTLSGNPEYIVINPEPASNNYPLVRKVTAILSNTTLMVDIPIPYTNLVSNFIKSPVGKVYFTDEATTIAPETTSNSIGFKSLLRHDILYLRESNANATVRFVNSAINAIAISNGGVSYSNTDYLTITGFESSSEVKGGYPATANIVTNANGTITAVHISNAGAGFVNTANLSFAVSNNSNGVTTGSNGAFTATSQSELRGEFYGHYASHFVNTHVINIDALAVSPTLDTGTTPGSDITFEMSIPYYMKKSSVNTALGVSYFINDNYLNEKFPIVLYAKNELKSEGRPVIPSRSNEFVIVNDVTGNAAVQTANSNTPPGGGVFIVNGTSNNDYNCIRPNGLGLVYYRYLLNNDASGENTDYGNAISKHITTKVNFENDRFAEDLLVYLTAYRPKGTDIKVYGRIHNSSDPEAFDDKDWTLMEVRSGDIYSSAASESLIEMTFGFSQTPNSVYTLAGTVQASNTSANVIGSGTTFTSNLLVNDLIKIWSPLFPNTYQHAVVSSITNNTLLTLNTPMTPTGLSDTGLQIDLIGRVGNSSVNAVGYPMQAFNNRPNDNVARYYNSSMVEFDTFNTFQLKVVFLADDVVSAGSNTLFKLVPYVDDIRATGVTA